MPSTSHYPFLSQSVVVNDALTSLKNLADPAYILLGDKVMRRQRQQPLRNRLCAGITSMI